MLVTLSNLKTYMDVSFSARQEDAAEMVLAGLQSELEAYLRRPIEPQTFVEKQVLESNHVGVPLTSFFVNDTYNENSFTPPTEVGSTTWSGPPRTIYLKNSPVISVISLSVKSAFLNETFYGEALRRTATITGATTTNGTTTYTSSNSFTKGQTVTVTGITPSTLNISNKKITTATASSFSVGESGASGTYVSGGAAEATGYDYTVRAFGVDFFNGFPDDQITITYTAGLNGEALPVFKLMILRAATREMQNMHDDVVGVKDLTTRNVAPLETGFMEKELLAIKRYKRQRIA